jgi:hypothetical protein
MAAEHEAWIAELFADLCPADMRQAMHTLAKVKASVRGARLRAKDVEESPT